MKRRFLKMLGIALALGALLTAALVVTVVAQELRTPTYAYYGKVLNVDEFLALVEADTPLHCTELPTVERYVNERSMEVDYICFHTQAEVDTYIEAVIKPERERLSKEYPDVQRARPSEYGGQSIQANH